MGNTGSMAVDINENHNIDTINFVDNTDAIDAVMVPNVITPIDIRFNKMYIIYQRVNGISKTFALSVKILDDNIFLYVTDILNNKTFLAHVVKILIKSGKNVSYYLKYIQISRDFTLISLPENDKINVYNLTKLLNRNILEYVDTVGITLRTNKHGEISSGIEIKNKVNDKLSSRFSHFISKLASKKSDSTYNQNMNVDQSGTMEFRHVDCCNDQYQECNLQPYKCV